MAPQKARDTCLAIAVFGALLLLPPILPFFDRPATVLGMPLIVVYVFGVWIVLIVAAWALSRHLPAGAPRPSRLDAVPEDGPNDGPNDGPDPGAGDAPVRGGGPS